jgi:hypothetical protein
MTKLGDASRHAVCVKNDGYGASLELHKVYVVLPDTEAARDGMVRVVDESGEDYLYPEDYFVPVDLPESAARAIRGGR